jgi:hypothetical protein
VLLEINQELLYESIQLVNSRNELKKEQAAAEADGTKNGEVDYAEEEKLANLDYNQCVPQSSQAKPVSSFSDTCFPIEHRCMRRLQANLTYMFALADRNKPANAGKPVPASPAYLTPPPLNLRLRLRVPPPPAPAADDPAAAAAAAVAEQQPADPVADRAERDQLIRGLYRKLQGLYPGIDPRKEPAAAPSAGAQQQGNAGAGGGRPGTAPGGKVQGQVQGLGQGQGQNGLATSANTTAVGGGVVGGQGSNHNSPAPTGTPMPTGVSGVQQQQGSVVGTPLTGNVVAPGLVQMQS